MKINFLNISIFLSVIFFSECNYHSNSTAKKDGSEEGKMIDGLKQGIWKYYDENGNLINIKNYKNDTLHGIQKTYHENGQISDESYYVNGILRGSKEWFENGKMSSELYFNEFEQSDSISITWFENGQILQIGYLKDGRMIGEWKEYDDKGELVKVENYDTLSY